MDVKKLAVVLISLVLLTSASLIVIESGENERLVTGEPDEDLEISVELTVNGEEDEVTIDEDDEVEIDVSIENDGETEETVELYVLEDDDPIAPHDPYEDYTVAAGESEEDTLTHDHVSDWEGEFYARLIHEDTDEVLAEVDVTVGDPVVDPDITANLEVNGEEDEVTIDEDDEVEIEVSIVNEGDTEETFDLYVVRQDTEEVHDPYETYDVSPDDYIEVTEDHDHVSDWEGEFYARLIHEDTDEVLAEVDVTVGDPVVDPDITANLEVNGEEDEVTIDEDDEVEIDVSIENNGETDETVKFYVLEDDDPIAPHDPYETYTVPAGGSEEDTLTHDHVSDWEGGFYARLIQEDTEDILAEVDVTVGDPDVDPVEDDPDWESLRILIGIALATFIVGIGVGLLYERKIKREK